MADFSAEHSGLDGEALKLFPGMMGTTTLLCLESVCRMDALLGLTLFGDETSLKGLFKELLLAVGLESADKATLSW